MYRQYIYSLIAAIIVFLVLIACLTVSIDPYGYFGMPRIKGISAVKPASATRNRIVKPRAAIRSSPKTLILGNSRPELGIDPATADWPEALLPVYNFGVPGASLRQQGQYALLDGLKPTVTNVFWGIDFVDFISRAHDPRYCRRGMTTVDLSDLGTKTWEQLQDSGLAIWSTRAILDTVWTLIAQQQKYSPNRTKLGFNPANDYWPVIETEGQRALFDQKNAELRDRLIGSGSTLVANGCNWSADLETLLRVMQKLRERGVVTRLFINPYHIDYLDIVRDAGLWSEFLEWKGYVASISRETGSELWDFSEPGRWHKIPVTTVAQGEVLEWFWEPAHYRKELGAMMLSEMLRKPTVSNEVIGKQLVP